MIERRFILGQPEQEHFRKLMRAQEARDFELPAPVLLRHRVRYFVDGLALGSAAFVESVFERYILIPVP